MMNKNCYGSGPTGALFVSKIVIEVFFKYKACTSRCCRHFPFHIFDKKNDNLVPAKIYHDNRFHLNGTKMEV